MEFDESKHPRAKDGKFTDGQGDAGKTREAVKKFSDSPAEDMSALGVWEKKKMTPDEKIASLHIDFERDNILPELNEDTIEKMGVASKPILLKSSIIKRNLGKHLDVHESVMEDIVKESLYRPIDVFPANPNNANYFHLAAFVEIRGKDGLKMGLVLLDADASNENIEIVHAYYVDSKGYGDARKKVKEKD